MKATGKNNLVGMVSATHLVNWGIVDHFHLRCAVGYLMSTGEFVESSFLKALT